MEADEVTPDAEPSEQTDRNSAQTAPNSETSADKNKDQLKGRCVARYSIHSLGASVFVLPYAMGQLGIEWFIGLLCFEAFSLGCARLCSHEILNNGSERGARHEGHFMGVERTMPEGLRRLIKLLNVPDVVNCNAFYLKVVDTYVKALVLNETFSRSDRLGITLITAVVTIFLLIGFEYAQKYWRWTIVQVNNFQNYILEINARKIRKVVSTNPNPESTEQQVPEKENPQNRQDFVDIKAIKDEMNYFNWKRAIILCVFMLILFGITIPHLEGCQADLRVAVNQTEPYSVEREDTATMVVTMAAVIIFALKNYTSKLPISDKEVEYEKSDFKGIVIWSEMLLVILYFFFACPIFCTFGGFTPPLSMTAYGKTLLGVPLISLAILFTMTAMSLRVIPCSKLVQVLLVEYSLSSEFAFWIFLVLILFVSLLVSFCFEILHMVLFAGSITCNLLEIIVPCACYVLHRRKLNFETFRASFIVLCHLVLLGVGCWVIFNKIYAKIAGVNHEDPSKIPDRALKME